MQKMMGLMRRCIDDYHMIEAGDRIAVGVSGGKDSLTLLSVLAALRAYYPKPFALEALSIDMGLGGMDFAPVEALCRELDVPFTCHAGDSQGPDTVRDALDFGAKRLGHGHHIYDDPSLWQRAIDAGVTLEVCPTSNIQCKTQPSYAEHPAKRLLDAGLRVTISTDNMTLAATTLDDEYRHCVDEMGFTCRDLVQMNLYAAEAAFLDETTRAALIEKLKPHL